MNKNYKRTMLYIDCVHNIQQYLIDHLHEMPAQNVRDLAGIISNMLEELDKVAEEKDEENGK